MKRTAAFVAVLAGCGRLGFDRAPAATDAGAESGGADAKVGTPMFVQSSGMTINNSATVTAAFNGNVRAGDTVIVAVDTFDQASITGVTNTAGLVLAMSGPFDAPMLREYVIYARVPTTTAASFTVTIDAPVSELDIRLAEFSGLAIDPLDSATTNNGAGAGTIHSAPVTTTSPNELVFNVALAFDTVSVGPGFELALDQAGDITEYAVIPMPTTLTAPAMLASATSWMMTTLAFRAE